MDRIFKIAAIPDDPRSRTLLEGYLHVAPAGLARGGTWGNLAGAMAFFSRYQADHTARIIRHADLVEGREREIVVVFSD